MNLYVQISDGVWGLWLVTWLIAAAWSDRAAHRPGRGREAAYHLITALGTILMFSNQRHVGWTLPAPASVLLILVQAAGFGFCWWARLHLGRLWSGTVGRKADHHIVDTGPYGLVRHPIYTGLITAAFGLAVLQGTVNAWLGAALITLGCWIKARLEERFLREELGRDAYDGYAARTPMLIPFVKGRAKFR